MQAPTIEVIVVVSDAVLFAVLVSLPPETTAVLVTEGGACAETFTVRVMAGYEALAASASLRVQVRVPSEQVHPVPDIPVAVRPDGRLSLTLTVPMVAAVPLLVTVIE